MLTNAPVIWLQEVDSTNNYLNRLLHTKPIEGLTVATYHQLAGKGQSGTTWHDETGKNLLCSTLLLPNFLEINNQVFAIMAMALAMHDLVSDYLPTITHIKWPNDVWVNEKKIGGMLLESSWIGMQVQHLIVGIGININQTQFGQLQATSLQNETKMRYQITPLLGLLRQKIAHRYSELKTEKYESIKKQYLSSMLGLNQKRQFEDSQGVFEGTIVDVDNQGRLVVAVGHNLKSYNNKEIRWLT